MIRVSARSQPVSASAASSPPRLLKLPFGGLPIVSRRLTFGAGDVATRQLSAAEHTAIEDKVAAAVGRWRKSREVREKELSSCASGSTSKSARRTMTEIVSDATTSS